MKRLYDKMEPHIGLFSENSRERWARIGEQVMCDQCIRTFSVLVIMRRILSQDVQICGIDKYWLIHYIKVSSCDYLSIYVRTPDNVDEYSVFSYSRLFSENWRMCDSAYRRILANTLYESHFSGLLINLCENVDE